MPLLGLVLFLCCSGTFAEAEYMKYKDSTQPIPVRIKDLLSGMKLEQKIGQMTQIECNVSTPGRMKEYSIGSLLSGGGSTPRPQANAEDWVNMVNNFQTGSLSSCLGILYIYGIGDVHVHNNVYKATISPHNVGLGCTRDPALVKRIGAATSLEVRESNIPYVFAPCFAVCRDPGWGWCYKSYTKDPKIVQSMTEIIPGLLGDLPPDSRK